MYGSRRHIISNDVWKEFFQTTTALLVLIKYGSRQCDAPGGRASLGSNSMSRFAGGAHVVTCHV